MKQRPNPGITFSVLLLAPLMALACSTSSNARSDAGVADVSAAIREDTDEIPCAPRLVLETVCQKCHALSPRNGAPFPLVRRSDVVATHTGLVVRELMVQQLEAGRMPLSPVTIDPVARDVLLEWLRAGAPAVTPRTCGDDGGVTEKSDADIADSASQPSEAGALPADAGAEPKDAAADSEAQQ